MSTLISTQLEVDKRIECSFSPNLYDAVVMPYDTRKVQRINYHSLHNTAISGNPNSSSEEDLHGSGLFSPLVSPVKVTSPRPTSLLTSAYFPAEGDMNEVKEIVSGGLDSFDEKEEEKIEAELALVLKEKEVIKKKLRSKKLKEQLEREKVELEELKKHGVAVGGMVEGKKGDRKEKEKRSQKKKDSGKSLIKKNFDIDDLRSNKKLLKAVHDQLKGYQLISDSSQTSSFSSEESDSEKRKTLSDSKDSSSESDSFTRNIKKKYRKNKRKSGLVVSSRQKTKYPQDCPQSKLQLEYANKKIKFEDLKFHQFVAGEMEIIVSCKNDKEKNGRLTLLTKISYYYELYDWKALLQFYAAWIRRVESGQNKWADDTADIETPLLASAVRSRQNRVSNKSVSIVKAPSVWFCSDFQKKKCSFSGAHDKVIKGVTRFVSGKNHAGARSHPDDMRKYLKKECTYGSIIGPFFSNPFETDMVISPLNSVPKKDTLDRRVILDLSFGVNVEDSVNSHIYKDLYLGNPIKVSYPTVDSLVELIRRKRSGSSCFKRDLKRAYRQIPICPGDCHLVGFSWENHFFFDRVLSMGLRSAAYICQRVTNALRFILDAHYDLQIVNYLDDLAGCDIQEKAFDAYAILGEVLDNCGLEVCREGHSSFYFYGFLGILFDTVSCTLSITKDRLEEILGLVKSWLQKDKCSLRDLQSLLGKLHFVSSCVRPGRLFVSRLLVWLRTFVGQNITKRVPKYIKLDLVWWSKFLDIYNGVSMMFLIDWSSPDCVLSCDSTLVGCGGICNGRYFHTVFPAFIRRKQLHINALELLCVMVCLKVWASVLEGSKIVIYCDNSSSVTVLNSGACRNAFMQSCLREICFLTASHEFQVKGRHLSGEANRFADMLSRWDMDPGISTEFLKQARINSLTEIELDDGLFHFTSP
ncbi:unnamed protein product [Mytilus coruscus]|uniref:Reverse transcriptase domain-containing protein n=1 Tax=Mytilus coruscus TaxID=42192 RepID=A0A6J8BJ94_MYTCO|nr:unnamed protein product [Mytilus coruscus]